MIPHEEILVRIFFKIPRALVVHVQVVIEFRFCSLPEKDIHKSSEENCSRGSRLQNYVEKNWHKSR